MARSGYQRSGALDALSDPAALTQVAVTDSLNGATFTGTALLTSATPTVDELEAIAGMLGLALNAALADIAVLHANQVLIVTALEQEGIVT